MARIRSIHPGIWTDEAFMGLSAYARLLLIGIWTEAYDDGVFEWKPLTLKARVFPVDNVDVNALLDELASFGLIGRIDEHPKKPGAIRNFQKFQRPKKPNSSGMLVPEWFEFVGHEEPKTTISPDKTNDGTEPVRNRLRTGTGKLSQMEDGGGDKKKEELRSSKRGTRLPDDFAPDIGWAMSHGLSRQQAQREAEKFRNYWIAKPGQGGVKKDWPATWRNWVLNCADRLGLSPPVPVIEDDEVWAKRLVFGRERLIWSSQEWGPCPHQPGCRVPNHLLEPADGTEWREWKREAAA